MQLFAADAPARLTWHDRAVMFCSDEMPTEVRGSTRALRRISR